MKRSNTVLGMRDKGSDSIPGDVGEIENEVLGAVIDRSAKNSSPVLQVCPSFLRGRSREGRETLMANKRMSIVE